MLTHVTDAKLPTEFGEFILHGFVEPSGREHLALVMGDLAGAAPLGRLHSECLTGDALFSQRCDCGPQLEAAMRAIAAEGRGIILYLRQEGRGIGLINKLKAYHLQDQGRDTVDANLELGFADDERDYSVAIAMLQYFSVSKIRVLTNNPRKLAALSGAGIEVVERIQLLSGHNPHNLGYLGVKAAKLGHLLK